MPFRAPSLPPEGAPKQPMRSDSAPDLAGHNERAMKEPTRPDRKRSRDDYNDEMMKGYMEEFITILKDAIKIQDDKLSKSVSEIIDQNKGLKDELTALNSSISNIRMELNTVSIQYNEVTNSLSELKVGQSNTQEDIKSLVQTVEFNSNQLKDFEGRMKKVENAAKAPYKLESEVMSLRLTVNELQYRLHQQQQWDRQLNLEFTGVPEFKNENLIDLTLKIAKFAGVNLVDEDIIHATRIQPQVIKPDRPKAIVVKLRSRLHKDNILAGLHKKTLTTLDLSMSGDSVRVFVSEHLTVENKRLFKACRDAKKSKGYKYCWAKNGRIFLRKNDTSPIIHIKHDSDLQKLH